MAPTRRLLSEKTAAAQPARERKCRQSRAVWSRTTHVSDKLGRKSRLLNIIEYLFKKIYDEIRFWTFVWAFVQIEGKYILKV